MEETRSVATRLEAVRRTVNNNYNDEAHLERAFFLAQYLHNHRQEMSTKNLDDRAFNWTLLTDIRMELCKVFRSWESSVPSLLEIRKTDLIGQCLLMGEGREIGDLLWTLLDLQLNGHPIARLCAEYLLQSELGDFAHRFYQLTAEIQQYSPEKYYKMLNHYLAFVGYKMSRINGEPADLDPAPSQLN